MSDDENERARDTNDTVQLDSQEIEALQNFPNFADHEEFVKTQEMDSLSRDRPKTDPSHSVLDTTQRYDVPDDLLQMAMRSQEMEVLAPDSAYDDEDEVFWREFVAIVDPRGRIVLPSRVQQELRGKKLRVKYIVED